MYSHSPQQAQAQSGLNTRRCHVLCRRRIRRCLGWLP